MQMVIIIADCVKLINASKFHNRISSIHEEVIVSDSLLSSFMSSNPTSDIDQDRWRQRPLCLRADMCLRGRRDKSHLLPVSLLQKSMDLRSTFIWSVIHDQIKIIGCIQLFNETAISSSISFLWFLSLTDPFIDK